MRRGRIVTRVHKLEVHFEAAIEALRKITTPSVAQLVVWRLAAGDWQSALTLLDGREWDVWLERYLIEQRSVGPNGPNDIFAAGFTDLTRLRQSLADSLADLAPELRWTIARRLLTAGTNIALGDELRRDCGVCEGSS